MSLINEALKKAQNMQARSPAGAATATAPAAAPKLKTKASQVVPPPFVPTVTTTATTSAARRPVGGSKTVLAIGAGLCIVAVAAIGFAMFVLFGNSPSNTTVSDSPADPAATTATTTGETATAAATDENAPDENAAPPRATPVAAVATPPPAPAEAAPTPPPPPPKRVNRPVARIQDFVNKITVSGIRLGERSRALMNDRVYAIGDLVNADMELRLTSITERELGFEDAEGNTYSLHF